MSDYDTQFRIDFDGKEESEAGMWSKIMILTLGLISMVRKSLKLGCGVRL